MAGTLTRASMPRACPPLVTRARWQNARWPCCQPQGGFALNRTIVVTARPQTSPAALRQAYISDIFSTSRWRSCWLGLVYIRVVSMLSWPRS